MWFWQRKEVHHGFDVGRQAQVRDILAAEGIKYEIRVVNLNQKSVGRSSMGLNQNYALEYYVYVNKKDFERAARIIR